MVWIEHGMKLIDLLEKMSKISFCRGVPRALERLPAGPVLFIVYAPSSCNLSACLAIVVSIAYEYLSRGSVSKKEIGCLSCSSAHHVKVEI